MPHPPTRCGWHTARTLGSAEGAALNDSAVLPGHRPAARAATGADSCLVFHALAVLFVGPLGAVARHTHAAPALLVGLDGPVGVAAADAQAPMQRASAWCIAPGWPHRVDGGHGAVAVLYLEPGSQAARAALRLAPGPPAQAQAPHAATGACPLPGADNWCRALRWARQLHSAPRLARLMAGLCEALPPLAPPPPGELPTRRHAAAQVLRALAQVRNLALDPDAASSSAPPPRGLPSPAAAGIALSASRLRHLVSAQAGTPLRRYRLWCRLTQAAMWAARGHSLTDAALAAGFADQAHFTRAFRAMFGLPPSAVLARPALRVWLPEAAAPLTPARPSRTRGR